MECTNPKCRIKNKRKLRPLVISLIPQQNDDLSSSTNPTSSSTRSGESRHEQITRMFTTHPSLAAHFEPPTFSPGVPQRDLRNRLKFLDHANRAGLIPEVEWEAIYRGVSEQTLGDGIDTNTGGAEDGHQADNFSIDIISDANKKVNDRKEGVTQKKIDPFQYLATSILIESTETSDESSNNKDTCKNTKNGNKSKKKNKWLEYETTSLVPISSERRGSDEDISLPVSMELWRKGKALNRDRAVLACTLAHLMAMKTLVGDSKSRPLDDSDDDVGFDFILEDNVRAFAGLGDTGDYPEEATNDSHLDGWSCECANRIWDIIEASKAAPTECHMRYYGWLGSTPNLTWVYENHIPRSAFGATSECKIFPFPTNDDFELDSIDYSSNQKEQVEEKKDEASSPPQFTTPGGTPVWGTYAYTVSPAAYHSLINQLQNDVGAMLWKGKRMRAYRAKPIDKILPRHVRSKYGSDNVHLPEKVAFVRGVMLGSLLHPQYEEGFCKSTELQLQLPCKGEDADYSVPHPGESLEGAKVWNHIWLTKEERQVVNHRKKSGKWVSKGDIAEIMKEDTTNSDCSQAASVKNSAALKRVIPLMATIVMTSFLTLFVGADAFAHNLPIHNRYKYPNLVLMSSGAPEYERKRQKLGKVPIMSRTIPIEIKDPLAPGEGEEGGFRRLDVTVWEMDKPADLIQEWWSIDESERKGRVGDPFGVVMWPGSILASRELMRQHHSMPSKSPIANATVLVLGAGTGVEAQTAALLGAKKVIATDINPLTLKLLEHGAKVDERIGDTFEGKYFDLYSDEALPACDILVAADVLYNPDLAKQVGRRIHEAIVRSFDEGNPPTKVIVTDSQKFHGTNFLEEVAELQELNELFKQNGWEQLKWVTKPLEKVCGSGVLIDEDQVYDVDVRLICWGW